ncbi:MAG TPA: FAD-dependent oxidoreductase [Vicinamibacteria bacterium]
MLSSPEVQRDLGRLTGREHDLLVVGGGIYGAAAAWDAAQRGLAVALVEAGDFGSGTSWNSLKTIHGGLRHLPRADLSGLREGRRERAAFLRIAPELVRPLPFLLPLYGHGLRGREAMAAALLAADLLSAGGTDGLAPSHRIPRSRILSREEVRERAPGLDAARLTGGAAWTDAQVESSERLLIGFLHAAAEAGAALASRVEVIELRRRDGRVAGALAGDREGGGTLEIRSHMVLGAAGPWNARLAASVGIAKRPAPLLRAVNLVLRRRLVDRDALGGRGDGRYLFLVPWRDRCIVGTGYEPAGVPSADGGIEAFLAEARRAFPWAAIESSDVSLVHRGLVPGRGGAAGLLTRGRVVDHEAEDGMPGLCSIRSVKYTGARASAEAAIDLVVRRLARRAAPCRTATTVLPRARPLAGTLAERARLATRDEMALHLTDAVLRRLDLGTAGPPAPADVEMVAQAMASERGWDAARTEREKTALGAVYAPDGSVRDDGPPPPDTE